MRTRKEIKEDLVSALSDCIDSTPAVSERIMDLCQELKEANKKELSNEELVARALMDNIVEIRCVTSCYICGRNIEVIPEDLKNQRRSGAVFVCNNHKSHETKPAESV